LIRGKRRLEFLMVLASSGRRKEGRGKKEMIT